MTFGEDLTHERIYSIEVDQEIFLNLYTISIIMAGLACIAYLA